MDHGSGHNGMLADGALPALLKPRINTRPMVPVEAWKDAQLVALPEVFEAHWTALSGLGVPAAGRSGCRALVPRRHRVRLHCRRVRTPLGTGPVDEDLLQGPRKSRQHCRHLGRVLGRDAASLAASAAAAGGALGCLARSRKEAAQRLQRVARAGAAAAIWPNALAVSGQTAKRLQRSADGCLGVEARTATTGVGGAAAGTAAACSRHRLAHASEEAVQPTQGAARASGGGATAT
mmetsp:Transcript_139169/g.388293  ORF Transcript_139169/g.388293 Transcript_139169/m.388293 type:complete len:235 (-) Transcript_139169:383-1087(-)